VVSPTNGSIEQINNSVILEVRKIKFNEALSEETACFSGELWDNGEYICDVSNRGQGGPNDLSSNSNEVHKKYGNLETESEILEIVENYNFVTVNQSKGWCLSKDEKHYTVNFPLLLSKLKKHKDFQTWK
jgi:hypothetical protein